MEVAGVRRGVGVKGRRAEVGTMRNTVGTGGGIRVPLGVEEGDVVKVDRREDKYLTRVSK